MSVAKCCRTTEKPELFVLLPLHMFIAASYIIIGTAEFLNLDDIIFVTATITKMSTPVSSGSSGVSNVTVSLARPVITSSTPVAIVPGSTGSAGASLVSHSPSKLVATTIPRSATTHKVAGTITGIVGNPGGGTTPVVSLASVTLQSQVCILYY